jgi:hypothetical protein
LSYIDKDYYDNEYEGDPLTDDEFSKFNKRSQDIIDSLTSYQIPQIGFDSLKTNVQELIKKAVCAQIEYFKVEGIESNINGVSSSSQSVSISGFSYSSSQPSSSRQTNRVSPSTLMYLEGTALLVKKEVKISVI